MITIWKYALSTAGSQPIDMPIGALPLHVQLQDGGLCMWAKVDTEQPNEKRVVRIYGTGHDMQRERETYVGTVQLSCDALVFHIFLGWEQL